MYDSKEKRRAYAREHYEKNKDLYKQRAVESKKRLAKERHSENRRVKESTPCADCGGRFHHVQMDWDHLPGAKKVYSVAKMINQGKSISAIEAEIGKCELVCANCHRLRTWNRAGVVE